MTERLTRAEAAAADSMREETDREWVISNHSLTGSTCVEMSLPTTPGEDVLVRDSENREGARLTFSPAVFKRFLATVMDGEPVDMSPRR